jgi:hypothetical protein
MDPSNNAKQNTEMRIAKMNTQSGWLNKTATICLISAMALLTVVMLSNDQSHAFACWSEGMVTRGPWQDSYTKIAIDDVVYTLMPKARLLRREKTQSGAFNDVNITRGNIVDGQQVLYRVQGNRIYELVIVS